MSNFSEFAKLVAASFQDLVEEPNVFVTGLSGDDLYARYLEAFPAGTNPIFKKASTYDCSCCKQFIRRAGAVVAVNDAGEVRTIWGTAAKKAPQPFNLVAARLRDAVLAAPVVDLYRVGSKETNFGAQVTHSLEAETGKALSWEHFYTGQIPNAFKSASPDQVRGDYRTTVQVLERGLVELSPEAVDAVVSLVEANALYRGEEHKPALLQFRLAQRAYLAKPEGRERSLYVWSRAAGPAARFRNTVIGTLVQDISEGVDLERAVTSFESKVAPQNYKRTTAIITPGMVKKAMETIESLGLEPALERRHARIGDVSVGDVKWVSGAVKPLMKGGIGEALMQHAEAASAPNTEEDEKRAEPIALDDFVARVLPEATGVELLFKSEHLGNLVSLTAPMHPEPRQLFRWSNDFAWSYCGNVADSIRERVKKAGGKVDGAVLRVSLSWFNYDDLDLHIIQPAGRGSRAVMDEIYYANKSGYTGGVLDVDMNAGGPRSRKAVENVVWSATMPDGAYKVVVNNFAQRETSDPGFVVEVESGGKLSHFSYNKSVRNRSDVHVATLHMKGGAIDRVEVGDPGITAANVSQEKWGLTTERYVQVRAVTLSPNYWGENAVGNKHTFFILEGCKSDEATRGFYNEFLHPRLEAHRKVFEVIADKTKCPPADEQLSGLGFSSTKSDTFVAKVQQGKKQRLFRVKVGK